MKLFGSPVCLLADRAPFPEGMWRRVRWNCQGATQEQMGRVKGQNSTAERERGGGGRSEGRLKWKKEGAVNKENTTADLRRADCVTTAAALF